MGIRPPAAFSVMVLVGLAGYIGCLSRHWCQCGHMAHPEISRWWDYPLDGFWIIAFGSAAVYSLVRWRFRGLFPAAILLLLIVSRMFFAHTMGLSLVCLEIPVSIVLFCICGFSLYFRFVDGETPSRDANGR